MKQRNQLLLAIITITILIIILPYKFNNNSNSGSLEKITQKELIKKQENKEDFILIISRTDCSHCISYKPKIEQIAKDYNLTIYYINIDKLSNTEQFLADYKLSNATPITLFFKNGKETSILNRLEGDLSAKKVKEQFKKMGFIN